MLDGYLLLTTSDISELFALAHVVSLAV